MEEIQWKKKLLRHGSALFGFLGGGGGVIRIIYRGCYENPRKSNLKSINKDFALVFKSKKILFSNNWTPLAKALH